MFPLQHSITPECEIDPLLHASQQFNQGCREARQGKVPLCTGLPAHNGHHVTITQHCLALLSDNLQAGEGSMQSTPTGEVEHYT